MIQFDADSNIIRLVLKRSDTGQGLTGLTSASSGLIISTINDIEPTATAYTVTGTTIETIAALATYATPTSGKCRFKEVDATNHPGLYELQLANGRFSVPSAKAIVITVTGATDLLTANYLIPLVGYSPYTGSGTTIAPLQALTTGGLSAPVHVSVFQSTTKPSLVWAVSDAAGTAIDLTGQTVVLTVYRQDGTVLFTLSSAVAAGLAISTNQVTEARAVGDVDEVGMYDYVLTRTTGGAMVCAYGTFEIKKP